MTLADGGKSGEKERWKDDDVDLTASGTVGEDLVVELKLNPDDCQEELNFVLFRGDVPMPSDRYQIQTRGNIVQLTLKQSQKEDSGHYALVAKKLSSGLSISDGDRGESRHKIRLSIQDPSTIIEEGEPPVFVRRLSDLAVKVGTRTRFLVEIRSSTCPKVTWHKNDEPVQSGLRFSFVHEGNFYCVDVAPVMVDDQGHWTCMAENGSGRSSCTSFLNVIVPKAYKKPEFVEELRALLTETGTVSLECKVVGVPTPVLKWYKDQKEIKAGDVFALTANPDDPTSLGTYTCEAINCMGTVCSSSRVHVVGKGSREGSLKPADALTPTGPLPVFEKILRDESCRIGDSLVLSCQVHVPPWPKTITWYNKEGRVEPGEKYQILADGLGGYSIAIKGVEAMDEGEWKCVATSNENVKQFSTCYVAMSIPKNYRAPRFMESLKAVLTEEGLVSFECKVVGFPTPLLRWFKDGQELHPGDVYQLTGTNSLGSYCCIARNCMGEAKSIAELTVEDIQNQLNEEERMQLLSSNQAPKFVKGLRSCEARINEDFTFTIQVSVSPEPSLSWYRDDVAVIESEKYRLARESLGVCNLEVKKLEFMDQAEWKCVAANDFGHSVTSCFLKLVIPKHFKKPKFLESLRAILSEEGAVNLECKVIGVPQPILKWYKDGVELKPGDIHRIISGQDGTCCLGTYTCEATNCMGSVSSSASLLGFEDRVSVRKEEAKEPVTPLHELARNLSLSTIHEERTSQLYDTPQTDHSITMDDRGEVSFSFDGKEVSVSLYETPDLTEEEALQIVEMYADQLSEHITEGNIIELPPMRFTKETSTTGNLLMEAVVIDVSPDYFVPDEEGDDLRTEADVEDVSIMDDQMQSIRSSSYTSPTADTPRDRVPSGSPPSRPPRRKESRESFSSRSERSEKSLPKGYDWSESYHSAKEPSLQAQSSLQGQDDSGEAFTDALSSSGGMRSKAEESRDIYASIVEQNIEKINLEETMEVPKDVRNIEETIATQIGEALIEEVPVKRKRKKKQSAKGSRTPSVSSKASSEESYSYEAEEKIKRRDSKNGKGERRDSVSSSKSGKGRKSRSGSESGRFESAASMDLRRRESDATIMVDDVRIEQMEEFNHEEPIDKVEANFSKENGGLEERPTSAASAASTIDSEKSMSKTNKERLLDNVYKLSEPVMILRTALVNLDSLLPLFETHGTPADVERAQIEIANRIIVPIENLCEQVSSIETKALKSAGDRSLAQNVRISLLEAIGGPTEELLRGIELIRRQSGQQDVKTNLIVLESLTDPVDEILVGLTKIEQELTSQDSSESPLVQLEKPIALERMYRAASRLGDNIGNIMDRQISFGDESTSCSVVERLQSVYQSIEAFLSTVPLSDVSGALENNVDTLVVETLVRPLEELSRNLHAFEVGSSQTQTEKDASLMNLERSMSEMGTRLESLILALETYEKESGEQGITELHADLVKFLKYTLDDAVERLEKLKPKKKRLTQELRKGEEVTPAIFEGKSRMDGDESESAVESVVESSDAEESKVLQELAEEAAAIMKKVTVPSIAEAEMKEAELHLEEAMLTKIDEKSSTETEEIADSAQDAKKKDAKVISEKELEERSLTPGSTALQVQELDANLSLPEMLLDSLIDVQANLSDVISDFESQESAEESPQGGVSELAACLMEIREFIATAAQKATTLKSASTVNALVDLREPLLDLQLAMTSSVSPEEIKLIKEAAAPLAELKAIVATVINSPETVQASQIQMKSVLRMLDDIEAVVAKSEDNPPTEVQPPSTSANAPAPEKKEIVQRPPEEVERAAVALTGVHFALSTALERIELFATEIVDDLSPEPWRSPKQIAERVAASNLVASIEELRLCIGNLSVVLGTPVASKDKSDQYWYDIVFEELASLEPPLLNLQKVLLTEEHGAEDRHILNDVASPIRNLKEIIHDVTRELGGGPTPIVLELIEDVEKDITLIAMEALKKALAAKSETLDDDGLASTSSSLKPGEVPGIISRWLDPVEDWLTSTAAEGAETEGSRGTSMIVPAVDELKGELLKIAIQTSYSEPPSDAALIESLTELREPLARVCDVLNTCHEPENLDVVEGLIQPMKHLMGTILDASLIHEAGRVLRPVLEAIEELENQIPLTIKRATYERELQRVVRSMTPEETSTTSEIPGVYENVPGEAMEKLELRQTSAGTSQLAVEIGESIEALNLEDTTALRDKVEKIKIEKLAEERAGVSKVSVKQDKSLEVARTVEESSTSEESRKGKEPTQIAERIELQEVSKLERQATVEVAVREEEVHKDADSRQTIGISSADSRQQTVDDTTEVKQGKITKSESEEATTKVTVEEPKLEKDSEFKTEMGAVTQAPNEDQARFEVTQVEKSSQPITSVDKTATITEQGKSPTEPESAHLARSETIEVITVDNRPFSETVTPLESSQTSQTHLVDTYRADQLDLWTLTLLGPLDRLGSAVLALDRSIDELAHGLLCRPLDSLHKQIEIAESQFNRPAGQSLENDVETIIEGFLSPVNQLHSALSSAVTVWNDEQPRAVVRDLLRSIADSSTELSELLDSLRKKLTLQRTDQSIQERQEDASLVETINAVIAPLDDVRNLIEAVLKSLNFADGEEKERIENIDVKTKEETAEGVEVSNEGEMAQEIGILQAIETGEKAEGVKETELATASASRVETLTGVQSEETLIAEELESAFRRDEELENLERAKILVEEFAQEEVLTSKTEVSKGLGRSGKGKEDSLDIEETTAKPLEELIEAIVDSSGPRPVSSSPEGNQSITPDISEENREKGEMLVGEEIIMEDSGSERVAEIHIDEFNKDKATVLSEDELSRAKMIAGLEIGESAREAVEEILEIASQTAKLSQIEESLQALKQAQENQADIPLEKVEEAQSDSLEGDQAKLLTEENLLEIQAKQEKSLMLQSSGISQENVLEENVEEILVEKLGEDKAGLRDGERLVEAVVTDAPETKIKAIEAEVSELKSVTVEESVEGIPLEKVEKEKAAVHEIEGLAKAELSDTPETRIKATEAGVSELETEAVNENLEEMLSEKLKEEKAELRETESLAKAGISAAPQTKIEAIEAEVSELGSEAGEESLKEIASDKMKEEKAEIREGEDFAKAVISDTPETKIKAREAEVLKLESQPPEESLKEMSSEELKEEKAEVSDSLDLSKAGISEAPETKFKGREAEISELLTEAAEERVKEISSEMLKGEQAAIRDNENLVKAKISDAPETKIKAREAEVSELEGEAVEESFKEMSSDKLKEEKAELRESENLAKAAIGDSPEIKIKTREAKVSELEGEVGEGVQEITGEELKESKADLREGESLAEAGITDAPITMIKARDAKVSELEQDVAAESIQEIQAEVSEQQKAELRESEDFAKAVIASPDTRKSEKLDVPESTELVQEIPQEESLKQKATILTEQQLHMAELIQIETAKLKEQDVIEAVECDIIEIMETPTQKVFKINKKGTRDGEPEEIMEKIVIKSVEEVVSMEDQRIVEIIETPTEKVFKMKIAVEGEKGVLEEAIEEIVIKKPVKGWAKNLVEEEERTVTISQAKIQEFATANISQEVDEKANESEQIMKQREIAEGEEEKLERIRVNEEKREAERLKNEEAERLELEEVERRKRDADEKQRKEEAERLEREELERQEKDKAEADRLRLEELERARKDEEERLHKEEVERLEREERERHEKKKQEVERLQREEEERLKREETERLEREEQERKGKESERVRKEEAERLEREELERTEKEAERLRKEEAERLEREEIERKEREAERLRIEEVERLEREELERKEKEAERLRKEEAERLEREELERKEKEAERLKKEEAERLEREELERKEKEAERLRKEEAERLEREELERKEKEAERFKKEEAERLEREELERKEKESERLRKEEAERLEKAELERKEKEAEKLRKDEAERLEKEELERKKQEAERLRKEEAERLEREELERKEKEAERLRKEEIERLEREELERKEKEAERLRKEEAERLEREELERKEKEAERLRKEEAERLEREELERKEKEAERLRKEEAERLEREELERQEKEAERLRKEAERLEREELERKEKEAERLRKEEAERLEKEEAERKEKEAEKLRKEEAERLEKEELERKKQEAERLKQEELERAKKEEEERIKKEEAERLKKEQMEREKQEAERLQQEELERIKKEEEERLEKEEAERKKQEQVERAKKEEAERLKKEEAERKKQEEIERAKKEEAARLENEKLEKEKAEAERLKKEEEARLEKEKLEKEKEEAERLKKEQAAKQEKERLEKEKADAERLKKEEEERLEKEKFEKEKDEAERLKKEEEERLEKEKFEKEKEEAERLKKEEEAKLEKERLEKEKAEAERLKKEEAEKLAKEKAEAERLKKEEETKLEKEKLEKEKAEAERIKKEEAAKLEKEKLEKEKAEAERLKKEETAKLEKEKLEKEKAEAERLKKEEAAKLEKEKLEKEKAEVERLKKEETAKLEKEKLEKEKAEAERLKKEEAAKLEKGKLEKETAEAERLKKEETAKLEKEKLDKEKAEAERLKKEEAAKLEKEKLEKEKVEAERLKNEEAAKLEKEKSEKEKAEAERLKKEKSEKLEKKKLAKQKEGAEPLKKKDSKEESPRSSKEGSRRSSKKDDSKEGSRRSSKKDDSKEGSRRSSKTEEPKEGSRRSSKTDEPKEGPRRRSKKEESKEVTTEILKKKDSKDESVPLKKQDSKEESKPLMKEDSQNESKRLKKDDSKDDSKRLKKEDSKDEPKRLKQEDSKDESNRLKKEDSKDEPKRSSKKLEKEKILTKESEQAQKPLAKREGDDDDDEKTPVNVEQDLREKSNKPHARLQEEFSSDLEPPSSSTIRTDSEMDSEYSESSRDPSNLVKSRRKRSTQQPATELDYETSKEFSERRLTDRPPLGKMRDETLSSDDRHYTPYYSSRTHEFTPGPRDRGKKPSFCTKLTDRTAAEASRIKLTCTVLGDPEPQVYWTKDGKELPSYSNRHCTMEDNGMVSLELYAVSPKDSGEYSCVAKNIHGQAYTEAKLKVYAGYEPSPALPTFTRSIKDIYRSTENELVLECRVRGQPSPKITWLKDGQILQIGDRYQQSDLGDGICRLKVSRPDFYDSGLYTCRAENESKISDCTSHVVNFDEKGTENRTASWRGSYRNLTSCDSDTGRPRFSSYLTDHSVPAGGTIALQVEVKGVPSPDITWMRGDRREPISAYKARTFADSGVYTLIVPEATESETGTYVCRASNAYGYVDTTANVEVVSSSSGEGGKPAMFVSRPAETMLFVTVGEDVSVSFRVNGVPKPRIIWMKGLRDITNGPRTYKESIDDYVRLTLKRASPSDEGTYCILAKNRYGCDRSFYTVKVKQRARSLTPSQDWGTLGTDNLLADIHDTERSYLRQVPGPITSEPVVVDGGRNWLALSWGKAIQHGPAPIVAYRVDAWLLGGEGGARWAELGITPVNSFDAFNLRRGGEYKFRITPRNRYGWGESVTMTNSVTVREVIKFPEFSKILPGQLKALRGEILRLECEVRSDTKAEVKWYRDTTDIEELRDPRYMTFHHGSKCTLTIQSIKEHDSGRYVCEATNPAGRVSTFARVQVVTDMKIVEADEKLRRMRTLDSSNGDRPPEFTMRLRDRRVQMTYPVRLTCQVSGHPEPDVTWYKNREEIFPDDNISFWDDESRFHTLEISHSTIEDSGVYMAKARNINGSVSCRCHLVVDKGIRAYVAPEFFRHLDAVYTAKAGGELRMTAQIEAYPTVGIVWHRDGHRLRPSRSAVMTLNHDGSVELSLAYVTPRDAGLYCCTATNEVGQAESTTRVTVIGATDEELPSLSQSLPDVVESLDVPYSKEPLFVTKPLSTEAIEGDTVIILCEVVGDPKPEVIWLRDFLRPDYYRDAAHFRRVGAGPQYRLEIPYAKLDFTGAYSVIAKNCHGEAKAVISLQIYARGQGKAESSMEQTTIKHGKVQTLPSIKQPLRDLRCCDGDAVTLVCKVHATPEPDVRWEKSGKLLPLGDDFAADFDGETARLSIQHIYPEDEGEYTCVAYNDLGKAFTSACLIVDVPEGKESALSRRLIRPVGLLSAESTPISTPRSTPIRSLSPSCVSSRRELKPISRPPRGQPIGRRPRLPTGPKFYAVPHNRVAEEGETVRFQCAVAGHPTPWVSWDKDGVPVTPTTRISLKEKDDVRILEITEINHEDAGLYRITLENDVGRTEATARLEIIKGRHSSVTRTIRTRSASPRTYSIYSRSPITSAIRGDTHLRPNIYDSTSGRGGTLSPTLPRWHHRNGKPPIESPEPARRTNKQTTSSTRTSAKNGASPVPKLKNPKLPIIQKPRSSSVPRQNPSRRGTPLSPAIVRKTNAHPGERTTKEENVRSMKKPSTKTTTTNGSMIPKRSTISRSRPSKNAETVAIEKSPKSEDPVDSDEIETLKITEIVNEEIEAIKIEEKIEIETLRSHDEESLEIPISPIAESTLLSRNEIQPENSRLIQENAKEPRPPIILAAPADVIALRGAKVILLATFDGEPQPRVRWLRRGRDVRLGDKAEIETSRGLTCLTLESVTTEHTDKYAVTLENIAGRDCRYVNVTIEDVPDPPAGTPCVQSITRSGRAIVTWRSPPYDGGCAVTGYSVEMKRTEEPCWIAVAEARHSLSHTVTGLTPEDSYRFRVRAENAHGVSEPSLTSDLVTVPGENDEEIGGQVFTAEINQIEIEEEEEEFEPAFEARIVSPEDGHLFEERYDVMEELGKGRYGIVRRIVEKSTGLNLAAKFVRTIKAKDRQQVHEEIGIMNRLRHPKLLRLAAAFENPKEMIMVTEYISGGELFERVVADDFTLTEKDSILFVKQICEGVEYMHSQCVVHLDLKPENIMCHTRTSHRIKLIDFGLAQTLKPDTPVRVLFGTPEFIPPEIIGFEPIGTESDMWSVGVICYVLLTGLSPFMGDNDAETFANITRADYDFDDKAFTAISQEATDFISALLVKRKELRMSAKECLEHPWLAQRAESMSRVALPTDKLKKFIVRRKWQKTGNAIRALGRMAILSANSRKNLSASSSPTKSDFGDELFTDVTGDSLDFKPIQPVVIVEDRTGIHYEEKWSKTIEVEDINANEEIEEILKPREVIPQIKDTSDNFSNDAETHLTVTELESIQDFESTQVDETAPVIQEIDDIADSYETSNNALEELCIEDVSNEFYKENKVTTDLDSQTTSSSCFNETTRKQSFSSFVNLEITELGTIETSQEFESDQSYSIDKFPESVVDEGSNEREETKEEKSISRQKVFEPEKSSYSADQEISSRTTVVNKAWCKTNNAMLVDEEDEISRLGGRGLSRHFVRTGSVSRTAKMFEKEDETNSSPLRQQHNSTNRTVPIVPEARPQNERIRKAFAFWNK